MECGYKGTYMQQTSSGSPFECDMLILVDIQTSFLVGGNLFDIVRSKARIAQMWVPKLRYRYNIML